MRPDSYIMAVHVSGTVEHRVGFGGEGGRTKNGQDMWNECSEIEPNSTVNRHGLDGSPLRRVNGSSGGFRYSQNGLEQEMRVMNS